MYEVRELEWEKNENGHLVSRFPFNKGKAVISKTSGDLYISDGFPVKRHSCNSTAEAKQKANEHWRGILKEFLREV